jgi:hypothetical protein
MFKHHVGIRLHDKERSDVEKYCNPAPTDRGDLNKPEFLELKPG